MSKSNFFTGQPVFNQLLNLIPRSIIDNLSAKHGSNHYSKHFMAYDHLVTMLYSSFFQCTSLRELTTGLQANAARIHHLGLKQAPKRSTLSDANKKRASVFFEDLYHCLYKKYFGLPDSSRDKLFIIDSTTISLFTNVMHGAGDYKSNGKKKGGAKAHVLLNAVHDIPAFISITESREHDLTFLKKIHIPDGGTVIMDKAYSNYNQFKQWDKGNVRWVTRLKNDAYVTHIMDIPLEETVEDILSDRIIVLGRPGNKKTTTMTRARLIEYYDKEKGRVFNFITNDFKSNAQIIAGLYKCRWQIELLFKRIKQRYPLKYFLGDNPNAIKIQIWSALICDLLVKIIQKQVNQVRKRQWSYANIAALIKHHLMTYINLKAFLINPENVIKQFKHPTNQLELFYMGLTPLKTTFNQPDSA
jgi:hypothetical protein